MLHPYTYYSCQDIIDNILEFAGLEVERFGPAPTWQRNPNYDMMVHDLLWDIFFSTEAGNDSINTFSRERALEFFALEGFELYDFDGFMHYFQNQVRPEDIDEETLQAYMNLFIEFGDHYWNGLDEWWEVNVLFSW